MIWNVRTCSSLNSPVRWVLRQIWSSGRAPNRSNRSVAGREQPGAAWESSRFCSRGFLSVCTSVGGRATCIFPVEALLRGKQLTEECMMCIVSVAWVSFSVPLGSTGCPQALYCPSCAGTLAPPLPQHHLTPEKPREIFHGRLARYGYCSKLLLSGRFLRNRDSGLEAELCLDRFCCWAEGSFMWVWVTGDRRFYSSLERLS